MASVMFCPAHLAGSALIPPSKSAAHRALLLAALGQGVCCLNGFPPPLCDDTIAMINGVTALGGKVRHEGHKLWVTPALSPVSSAPMAECQVGACAAALRMLIPVFLARGQAMRFVMEQSLFNRPLDAFEPLFRRLGAHVTFISDFGNGKAAIEISGFLPAGSYEIDGTRSSQFASGMLIALAHAAVFQGTSVASTLAVSGPIVSRPYLDMTLKMMGQFHVPCREISKGVFEITPACHSSPAQADVPGDWTQASVFLCMNAMGSDIQIRNLSAGADSMQGDARIEDILKHMTKNSKLNAVSIDCSDIPDLAPVLALVCSQAEGISVLSGVSRLRIKESDRLDAVQALLAKLGVKTSVSSNSENLYVNGPVRLRGGFEADARSDHRLVMFLAAAASFADSPITVHGVECISKSWPGFMQTYQQLGGKVL